MVAEAESLLAPLSNRTHTRAPSSTSTAEIVESSPCCCHHHLDEQQPSTSASATLRSNTSDSWSSYSCNISQRNCCPSCDPHFNVYSDNAVAESYSFLPAATRPASTSPGDGLATNGYASEDEDSVLRYSFKGIPPELYSAKKEFIYRRPLVEKQLVLKKTCEWWFYRNKCSNMSTHWKHNAFLILTTCLFIVLGLIIFFSLPAKDTITNKSSQHKNTASNWSTTTTSITITTPSSVGITSTSTSTTFAPLIITPTTTSATTSTTTSAIKHILDEINGSIDDDDIDDGQTIDRGGDVIDITGITSYNVNQTFEGDEEPWGVGDDLSNDIENDIEDISHSIPDDYTSDFVTPIKFHNFTLSADDLLYESKRNLNNSQKDYFSAYSGTGTFRSKSSQIWDPHPEYIFTAFGKRLHLVLSQDTSFIPPKTFRVINILNNRSEEVDLEEGHYLGCYYKGHVDGDDQSAVAVSLCHGMTGYIKTSFGSLLIQPVNNQTQDSLGPNASATSDIVHKVWRHSRRNARHAVSALDIDLDEIEQSILPKLRRKKRNFESNQYTIELLVAVDRTMKEFHKENLTSYILTLISIVSNVFADATIGNPIKISVANILVLQDLKRQRRKNGASNQTVLESFCSQVASNGYHYDTAMLITRNKICRKDRETKCDTLGLAELGTVCRRKSCSIVQDNGLPAAFTIAHELGHILNMPHDDDYRCKQFNKPGVKRRRHIMSSVMERDIHPWSWSDCSRYYVSEFFEKEDISCLEDTPTKFLPNYNTKQPGQIYTLDQQCQLIHGNESVHCPNGVDCKHLWCKSNTNCHSSNLPWADGTPCNDDRFWCMKGECVPRDGHRPVPIHGGWGTWSEWSACSLTCGGGVQESQRECNQPLPQNGGKYCIGARKKYRSCNTQNCPPGSMDAREQQCYQMNGRRFGIKGIGPDTKWIPKYGLSTNDKCNLYCRGESRNTGYFRLAEKVIDGTTCSFDTFDKCINGVCRPAGCDNELNSIAKLDKCGICEGRNDTCEDVSGNFYVSDLLKVPIPSEYSFHVTTIPKGASNIVIEQPGNHDENYIVLRDDQGKSLMNGDHLLTAYHNISYYAGVAYEYNGSNSTVERVNTTYTKKLKRDLRVEIISLPSHNQRDNDTLLLTYSYTIERKNYVDQNIEVYRWDMQEWSTCDSLCQGSMHRLPVCISATKGLQVAPQFCDMQSKPPTEYRACNTDCVLSLNVTGASECSASCGMLGTRELTYQCIQTFNDFDRSSNIVDLKYCAANFNIKTHEECREGCWKYTDWMPCSRSCGYGVQTRSVACYYNNSFAHDDYCNAKFKANLHEITRICSVEPCQPYSTTESALKSSRSLLNNWWAGDWGDCNDKCEKNRTVICRSPQGIGCAVDRKPITRRKCCTIKYVSNWSSCSVQCGNGTRHKEMNCARVYKPEIKGTPRRREYIDTNYCRHLRVPKPKRSHKPCKVSCKWAVSNWSQCPADCSDDYQSRSVYCESIAGNPINHTYCDASKKPPVQKICNNCVKRELKLSNCHCKGYRRKSVYCYDSRRQRVDCPTKVKEVREKCRPPPHCKPAPMYQRNLMQYPTSCYEIQKYQNDYRDGEYRLYVRSMPVQIYCHGMDTAAPKEFVTLNATENYSIYYDHKTQTPDQCPPDSRFREYRDNSLRSGRTTFQRIRIDIVTLRVFEDDYTYAETLGQPQPYGSAGDCYNRRKQCPQGDFSINLKHTGFRLRHGAVWEAYGFHVVIKESSSNTEISHRAFCGGWCGGCRISNKSPLYLTV
ncbi:A disintegrin and metalloproteinase with thrombospondin motifs 9 [Stomoxys calcitrans]|uniref:A disintegrin and metalloproteinase with thrombospondin motifs 9 n=1 Tax=Stomoxys calcitrans TaxID=35570 RepID=UPI0027E36E8F|nr:A disintegrin and metalloproteinase with thrombospondin motifs 9 [Stomoxys calcitrans]